jgi:hypothetical protein
MEERKKEAGKATGLIKLVKICDKTVNNVVLSPPVGGAGGPNAITNAQLARKIKCRTAEGQIVEVIIMAHLCVGVCFFVFFILVTIITQTHTHLGSMAFARPIPNIC